jgi:DNA invertase Pin-like site-specific DNA recombinase
MNLKTTAMKKVLYLRCSTIEQNVERQMKEGFDIVFTDYESGSTPLAKRKEGSRMLEMVNLGLIESINVHSIDRLGRNVGEMLSNIELFNSHGVCVISEKEGVRTLNADKTPNPIAKLILSVLGSIAEFELHRIKERTKEGIERKKASGGYIGRSEGSIESKEVFMSKAKNRRIFRTLKMGRSIRECAKICDCSVNLVMKVRDVTEIV